MLVPGASGATGLTASTDSDELNPPPLGWAGGCSSVVPYTVIGTPATMTLVLDEVSGRRSATPLGDGKVVRSVMRKRSRVTGWLLALVNVRRMLRVPKVLLWLGSEVRSRTRFGAAITCALESTSETARTSPIGLVRFSGPG